MCVYILFGNMHVYNWKDPCSWSSKLLETVLLLGAESFSSESFKTSAQSCNPLMALRTFLLSLASPCDRCQVFGGGAFPFTTNLLPPIFGLGRGPGRSGTGPAMTGAFPKAARFFSCRSRCSCCNKVKAMFATFAVWPKKPSHSATVGAVVKTSFLGPLHLRPCSNFRDIDPGNRPCPTTKKKSRSLEYVGDDI